ncbi:hypothetical protein GCM10020255_064120 [Rhodococcus baikonurensis]
MVVALAALAVVGVPMITQMGISAAVAVIIAVLGAITLIPAVLGIFGRFAFSPRIPGLRHGDEPETMESNGHRWAKIVTKYPWPIAGAALVLLVIAAIPMTKLELGLSFTQDEERPALALLQRGSVKASTANCSSCSTLRTVPTSPRLPKALSRTSRASTTSQRRIS